MHEPLEFPTPTLTERLRAAAVARAEARGDIVDGVVLDDDGVIDLRVPEPAPPSGAGTDTPAAITAIRGGVDCDVTSLYRAESDQEQGWWRRRRNSHGLRSETTAPAPATPSLAAASLTDEIALVADTPPLIEEPIIVPSSVPRVSDPVPASDLAGEPLDEARPTAICPVCDGTAQRDLWDRFSDTDYFSCDMCHAMWQTPHR